MSKPPLRYAIVPANPAAHLFEVTCSVEEPDAAGQRFALPAWIPGSYLIREFARNVVTIRAAAGGRPVPLIKLDKHTWQAAPLTAGLRGPLSVTCEIYAWDLSVRGAHLDQSHGFFNGASVFLRVVGREDGPCLVEIRPPSGARYEAWRVATALPVARGVAGAAERHGFGLYRAADYDELIDHPVEMGTFALADFAACGVRHEIAVSGRHDADLERLCRDLKTVCEWHIRLFGEPAPMRRYLFSVTAVGEGYGGLEHRESTALMCSRNDLPARGATQMSEAYRGFLGLCSHEYFHAWNIKRIKPAAFVPYDLDRENYTPLLWVFEGFTSYYDDLALVRSGVIEIPDYLKLLAKTIGDVHKTPGRHKQSLAEASFDAWIKYYRPDENTPNAGVSYYAKGTLVALALDLKLRIATGGKAALDGVMRALWERFGRRGSGVAEDDVRRIAEKLSGLKLGRWLRQAVHGNADLELAPLLERAGVRMTWEAASAAASLGVKTRAEGIELRLAHVFDGGAAQKAGLAAGDCLVAIDGLRVTPATLERMLERLRPGATVEVLAFRRDELLAARVVLDPPARHECKLAMGAKPSAAARKLRAGWLGHR